MKVAQYAAVLAAVVTASAAAVTVAPTALTAAQRAMFERGGRSALVPVAESGLVVPYGGAARDCASFQVEGDQSLVIRALPDGNAVCYCTDVPSERASLLARRNADGSVSYFCQSWPFVRVITGRRVPLQLR